MKTTKLHLALLSAALMLPAFGMAADENQKAKEEPRPAQESRGANTTGKDSTKPSSQSPTPAAPAPANAEHKTDAKPADAKEDSKTQPRPAQESRSSAPTGRDTTKSPEKDDKAK